MCTLSKETRAKGKLSSTRGKGTKLEEQRRWGSWVASEAEVHVPANSSLEVYFSVAANQGIYTNSSNGTQRQFLQERS